MRLNLVVAVVTAVLLASCAEDGTRPSAPQSTASTSRTPSESHQVRLQDDGSTVALGIPGTLTVLLPSESYTWSDPVVAGNAVTISEDISDEGSTSRSWTVTARRLGTAVISAVGSPTCRSATPPCAAPDEAWQVQVVVQ